MDLLTATVAERPDLARLLDDFNPWPRFMHQDPVGSLYYADPVGMYPEFVQVAIDRDHPGQLVAKAYSVPFTRLPQASAQPGRCGTPLRQVVSEGVPGGEVPVPLPAPGGRDRVRHRGLPVGPERLRVRPVHRQHAEQRGVGAGSVLGSMP